MPPPRRNVARRETGAFDIGKPPRSSEMANSRALGEPSTEGCGTGTPWPPVPSSSCRGRRARWESPSLPEEPPGGIRKIGSTVLGHDSSSNHSRSSSHAGTLERSLSHPHRVGCADEVSLEPEVRPVDCRAPLTEFLTQPRKIRNLGQNSAVALV